MDGHFRVSTSADLSGLTQLKNMMNDIEKQARNISREFSKWQPASISTPMASGGTVAPSETGTPQRRQQRSGVGEPRYNLDTPQGFYQWMENVYEPEAGVIGQMTSGFNRSIFGSGRPKPRPRPASAPSITNTQDPMDWFTGIQPSQIAKLNNAELRSAYSRAMGEAAKGNTAAVADFANQYGSQLGWQTPTPPSPGGGGGGGGRGGVSTAAQFGGAAGSLAKKYMPWLTVGGAVMYAGSQVMQGYGMWQQSSAPIDQLSHSLGTAAQDVEKFRQQVTNAGAQFGWSLQQSTQAALTFTQTFGNVGQNNISNMVGSTAKWALQNGLSFQQATQITSMSGLLGITSGKGSSMTTDQYQNLMSNMAVQGGMLGRQAEVDAAYGTVSNQIGMMNPIIQNPKGIAGMLTAMSATGIQGLQGMRGASIAGQFVGGTMNAQGMGQSLMMSAIMKASGGKITDPLQMLYLMQSGPQAKITGTNMTVGQATMNMIRQQSSNPYVQESMMVGAGLASSMPNAKALLDTPNLFTTNVSTQDNSSPWYSAYDINQITGQTWNAGKATVGGWVSPFTTAFHTLGFTPSTLATMAGAGMIARYGVRGAAGRVARAPLGIVRGIGGLWSRFGGLIKGVGLDALGGAEEIGGGALDATGVGSIAGIPLNVLGAATIATGTGMVVNNLMHQSTTTTHSAQVRQQSQSRTNRYIGTMTIDNLKINQITMPNGGSGSSDLLGSGGNTYAPTSLPPGSGNTTDGPNWFQRLIQNTKSGPGGGTSSWSTPSGATTNYQVPKSNSDFVNQMLPYAQQVSKATGIPALDILGQWGYESAGGKSEAAKENLNFAGINTFGKYGPGKDSAYAGFSSLEEFAQADAQVLNQTYYVKARNAAKGGADASTIGYDLASGGYATQDPGTYGAGMQTWVSALTAAFEQALSNHATKQKIQYVDPNGNPIGPVTP